MNVIQFPKAKWTNLLRNKCPKCGFELERDDNLFKCKLWAIDKGMFNCDFLISLGTMEALKAKMKNAKGLREIEEQDNLKGLNNL